MKNVILGALILALACSWSVGAPADEPALLTRDEAKSVDAVISSMTAAGFPDAHKATVYTGKLGVSATYDPAKTAPPLPSAASQMQMTDPKSAKVTYSYMFEGLHFKLADGSWIISLAYHFTPKAGDSVNTNDLKELNLATLTADAAAAHPFDAETKAAKWLERIPPNLRHRSAGTMNKLVPVNMMLRLTPDSTAPAVVLLHDAGWPDAAEMSLVVADNRSRNYWQLRPWTTPDGPFDPTGAYPNAKDEENTWKESHAQFTPEATDVALRRTLFRWCRAQLMVEAPEDAMFSTVIAAATAKAAVDPKDPQGYAKRIDDLATAAKLPETVAKNAALDARLQSWEARQRIPRMVVTGGNGAKGGGPQIATSFVVPQAAYTPANSDLDALVALLDDSRPSRFMDFTGSRTVGDNAWRAMTVLLKGDPRKLAGYPTDKAWTPAERKSAAAAVRAWWKQHRKEYVEI